MLVLRGPSRFIAYAVLAAGVFVIIAPFLWVGAAIVQIPDRHPAGFVDISADMVQLRRRPLLATARTSRINVWNSVVVASGSTVFVLITGTLAAYSLSRLKWNRWLARGFLGWTLIFNMIPPLTLVGPWYLIFRETGLYGSLTALILAHITLNLPMTIWMMMAYFNEIPREIEDAARVDGCDRFDTFWRIALPLVTPGLIAAGVLAFVFSWNEFAVALNLTDRSTATVPVAIARFAQQYEVQYGQMAAASILSTIPGPDPDVLRPALRRAGADDGRGEMNGEASHV